MKNLALLALVSTLSLPLAACSTQDPAVEGDPDLAGPASTPDLGTTAADMTSTMPVACELPPEHKLIDMPAKGAVMVTPEGAGFVAEIDGTAGGPAEAQKNAYVYLDLIAGKKVEISDVAAQKSSAWDIGFKRWQIKINSGDSGPGGVKAVMIPNTELSQVSTAPASGYAEDDYLNDRCQLQLDGNGGPKTALSSWYDYNINTHVLTPWKQVYVLTRRDGKGSIKLQVMGYYKNTSGGYFTVRWAFLP